MTEDPTAKSGRKPAQGLAWARLTPPGALPSAVRFSKREGEARVKSVGTVFLKPAGCKRKGTLTAEDVKATCVTCDDVSVAVMPSGEEVRYLHAANAEGCLEEEQEPLSKAAEKNVKKRKGVAGVPDAPRTRPQLASAQAPPLKRKWQMGAAAGAAGGAAGASGSGAADPDPAGAAATAGGSEQLSGAVRAALAALPDDAARASVLQQAVAGLSEAEHRRLVREMLAAAPAATRASLLSERLRRALPAAEAAAVSLGPTVGRYKPLEMLGVWAAVESAPPGEANEETWKRALRERGFGPEDRVPSAHLWRAMFAALAELAEEFVGERWRAGI